MTLDQLKQSEGIEISIERLSIDTIEAAVAIAVHAFGEASEQQLRWQLSPHGEKPPHVDEREYNKRCWVAKDKAGEVVGISGLYELRGDSPTHAWLEWFAVKPDQQRKKVGEKLLTYAEGRARQTGKSHLFLQTSDRKGREASAKLYEKDGLAVCATIDKTGETPHGPLAQQLTTEVIDTISDIMRTDIDGGVTVVLRGKRLTQPVEA